jgi:AraC-like DNA-binding protein
MREKAPTFPRATAEALLEAFAAVGLDSASIGANAGVGQPGERVPAPVWGRLWEEARRRSPDPLLPSRVGLALPFGAFGLVDYLTASAPTLDEGLSALARSMGALASLVSVQWSPPALEVLARSTAGVDNDEFTVAVVVARVRHLLPEDPVRRVLLGRAALPGNPHAALFGVPVAYGTARSAVDLREESIDLSPTTADPALHRSMRQAAEALGVGPGRSALEIRIRALLPDLLPRGRGSAAEVAAVLGLSRRTLYRRLAEEDVTFRQVVDGYRLDAARRLLATKATLAEIAAATGYADQAAFTRAFKRWFGCTPGTWRSAHPG